MKILSASVSADFGLSLQTSDGIGELETKLKSGGMAVVNVGGDRDGYTGLFSNGGHYIVAAGTGNGKIVILDPGYYDGKFSKSGRAGKVELDGYEIKVLPKLLDKDAENRSPRYYMFKKD